MNFNALLLKDGMQRIILSQPVGPREARLR